MNYQYIKAFLAVARELNFTRAAGVLGLTQAAVSRQIKLLEEDLGEQLLIRNPKHVLLTSRGDKLFKLWQSFEVKLQEEYFEEQSLVLKIGVVEGVLANWLAPHIEKLFKSGINVEVYLERTQKLTDSLEKGDLDLLLTARRPESSLFSSKVIFKESNLLISPRKSSAEDAVIIYSDSDPLMGSSKRYIQVNSIREMIRLVEAGLGRAVIPTHSLPKSARVHATPWKSARGEIFLTRLKSKEKTSVMTLFDSLVR